MKLMVRRIHLSLATLLLFCTVIIQQPVAASPFGQGVFGADVPFGSLTSLSITLGGDVSVNLTPSGSNFTGSGSNTVTVTSNDVIGYRLYLYTPTTTDMTLAGASDIIPASSNSSAAPLVANTWGFNTDGSSNYIGIKTTPTLLKDANGPYKSGDTTTVTYGATTTITKGAGNYSATVVYSAAPKNP